MLFITRVLLFHTKCNQILLLNTIILIMWNDLVSIIFITVCEGCRLKVRAVLVQIEKKKMFLHPLSSNWPTCWALYYVLLATIRFYLVIAGGGRVVSSAGRVVLEFELWTWGEQLRYCGENATQQQRESHNLAGSAVLEGSCGERPKPRQYGVLPRSGKRPEKNSAVAGQLWVSGAVVCRAKFNFENKLKV